MIRRHRQAKCLASGTAGPLRQGLVPAAAQEQTQPNILTTGVRPWQTLSKERPLLTYRCPPALLLSYSTSPSPPAHEENTFNRFGRPSFIGQIDLSSSTTTLTFAPFAFRSFVYAPFHPRPVLRFTIFPPPPSIQPVDNIQNYILVHPFLPRLSHITRERSPHNILPPRSRRY